ncbi:hypothetical protein LTS18_001067 [Coniosporium uncinatum]|uniref:Uncharacterized protein n=1 Tax=Coniosporium uncinatum TaxID=93489 RepID=A0ACC3DCS0_9PEZI|nr:hypothetical protein LTS18_001067 [Coniosporium uncinatum]
MSMLLRRGLKCFYCDKRSRQKQTGSIRQWDCENCEASNYLDESGNVTEPPPLPTPTPSRLRQFAVPRAASPKASSTAARPSGASLFCATCLKNQHFISENLRQYLPDEDDPQYSVYEAQLPTYKAQLETRYPPVCDRCAPLVEEKIARQDYAAKTDYLQRVLDRTRGGLPPGSQVGWRDVLVLLGGLGWWSSMLAQLLWHGIASMPLSTGDELFAPTSWKLAMQCAIHTTNTGTVDRACVVLVHDRVPYTIALSALCIWWNDKLGQFIHQGRMTGLKEYYTLQIVILALKAVPWLLMADPLRFPGGAGAFRGASMALFLSLCFLTIRSYNTVRLIPKYQVSWTSPPRRLAPGRSTTQPENLFSPLGMSNTSTFSEPFPIDKLAAQPPPFYGNGSLYARSASPGPSPFHPDPDSDSDTPTSPTRHSRTGTDPDSMDWTPTRSSFQRLEEAASSLNSQPTSRLLFNRPSTANRPLTTTANNSASGFAASPSPFHGTLPPAPLAPAHRLRNPPAAANAFRAASAEKQARFQAQFRGPQDPLRNPPEHQAANDGVGDGGFVLAPPKFMRKEDLVETGLEGMFDSVFSLGDESTSSASASARRVSAVDGGNGGGEYGTSGALPTRQEVFGAWGAADRQRQRQRQEGQVQNSVTMMLATAVALAGGTFLATKGFGEWGWGESVVEWAYGGQAV